VLGRLLARLAVIAGGTPPSSGNATRAAAMAQTGYLVVDPAEDARRDYRAIYDVSGDSGLLDELVARLAPGGEIVLAASTANRCASRFAPAFMREARLRVAAEWRESDLVSVRALAESGLLSLGRADHASRRRDERRRRLSHRVRRPCLPEDDPRLEVLLMNASGGAAVQMVRLDELRDQLRARRPSNRSRSRPRPPHAPRRSSRSTARAASARASRWRTSPT